MYKRIYYDKYNNKIHLWEVINGKTVKKEEELKLKIYIPDKSKKSPIKDIYGNSVKPKYVKNYDDIKNFKETGIKTYEGDINGESKFLQEYYFDKELVLDTKYLNICYLDIEIASPNEFPKPEDAKYPINLVTMKFSQSGKVVTYGLHPFEGGKDYVKEYHHVSCETLMLEKVIERFRKEKVDIITGWNVEHFDCLYIENRKTQLGIEKSFSPLNKVYITKHGDVHYAGLSILDYQQLYKKYNMDPKESYSLQSIGTAELGEGKLDYEGQINDLYIRDWGGFVEYNVQDVLLVEKLENKLKFIELMVNLSYQSLIPFQKAFSQMAVLTGYVLKTLHSNGLVLHDREYYEAKKLPGAYVYAKKGVHKYVVSFDVASMYPHQIMGLNIGPDTLVMDPDKSELDNLNKTPLSEYKTWTFPDGTKHKIGGVYYRKDKKSVLNIITSKLYNDRKYHKKEMFRKRDEGDEFGRQYHYHQQYVRKILLNSLYGVLGNKHFQLYNHTCAMTITLSSQNLIKYLSETLNDYFINYYLENEKLKNEPVVLVDTDSSYCSFEEIFEKKGLTFETHEEYVNWFNKFYNEFLDKFINQILQVYADRYGVEQIIEFEKELMMTDMIVLAKKKYVLKICENEGEFLETPKIKVKGVEIIKTSTPSFCRKKLLNVVDTIFTRDKEKVLEHIRTIRKEFRKEDISNIAFPRGVSEYTKYALPIKTYLKEGLIYKKATPIHVRASINYNYTLEKYGLKLIPITNGTKMKFLHISDNNFLHQNIIGFINQYPEKFKDLFKPDYDLQFQKSFTAVLDRFFEVMEWGPISLQKSNLKKLIF